VYVAVDAATADVDNLVQRGCLNDSNNSTDSSLSYLLDNDCTD